MAAGAQAPSSVHVLRGGVGLTAAGLFAARRAQAGRFALAQMHAPAHQASLAQGAHRHSVYKHANMVEYALLQIRVRVLSGGSMPTAQRQCVNRHVETVGTARRRALAHAQATGLAMTVAPQRVLKCVSMALALPQTHAGVTQDGLDTTVQSLFARRASSALTPLLRFRPPLCAHCSGMRTCPAISQSGALRQMSLIASSSCVILA